MSPERYKQERSVRGTQQEVADQLGVHRVTIAKREAGTCEIPVEAWLALMSLPVKKKK